MPKFLNKYDGPPLAIRDDLKTDEDGGVIFIHDDPTSTLVKAPSKDGGMTLEQVEELLNAAPPGTRASGAIPDRGRY